jgi:phage terminase large subunit-like protein
MHVGKPLVLEDFQQEFFRALFDRPPSRKVRRAIWSMARKNAKTVTIACLLLIFLVGPEARQNSQIVSGAMSREQAALVFDACCKIIRMSAELSKIIRIVPSKKMLVGLPMNVTYVALSAEGKTAHGLSPLVVIVDELGQVVGPQSDFFDALVTSQGAHTDPLLLVISTQAANDADLLSMIIDDALSSDDPHTLCKVYTAPAECSLMDESAWRAANPALGKFRSIDDVREQAQQAQRLPATEGRFRNLILNQRVTATSPAISKTSWKACADAPYPLEECSEIYGGLDLSGKTDLTSFNLFGYHAETKTWNAHTWAWTPEEGLVDRARRDRAPYDVWVKQGFLLTTPGATVDYEFVAPKIGEIISSLNVEAIGYDRWRIDILKKELERIGLALPLVEFGQGFRDMSPAWDSLEGKILNSTLRHGGHPVLTMCAANAKIVRNPAGDRKFEKIKISGRIDCIVGLAIAAGVAERKHEKPLDISGFLSAPLIL